MTKRGWSWLRISLQLGLPVLVGLVVGWRFFNQAFALPTELETKVVFSEELSPAIKAAETRGIPAELASSAIQAEVEDFAEPKNFTALYRSAACSQRAWECSLELYGWRKEAPPLYLRETVAIGRGEADTVSSSVNYYIAAQVPVGRELQLTLKMKHLTVLALAVGMGSSVGLLTTIAIFILIALFFEEVWDRHFWRVRFFLRRFSKKA